MQPQLVFAFPIDVDTHTALNEVAAFFEVSISIDGAPANVPASIKQAVERIGADNPASGVETNPAVAFGALMIGAGSPNVSAPSSAGAATSATAQTANTATSQTSAQESSANALPLAPTGTAQQAVAGQGSPAVIDKDGLPHDVRIHSKDPTLTDKGFWRKKRGVTDDTVRTVEAQLRAIVNLPKPESSTGNAQVDELSRKAEAVKFAHDEAVRVCGPQPMDDITLNNLLAGKTATLSPEQADWYHAYFSKRNAAYGEFISRAATSHVTYERPLTPAPDASTVADVVPVTPISKDVLLDAAGLPWDARINLPLVGGNGLKDPSGVYIQRMDVPGETKLAIMAELRGNGAASTTQVGVVGTTPAIPQVSAADAGTSFPLMMRWLVQNQMGGKLTLAQVSDVAKSFGFADADGNGAVALMASRTDYFAPFVQTLQAYGAV